MIGDQIPLYWSRPHSLQRGYSLYSLERAPPWGSERHPTVKNAGRGWSPGLDAVDVMHNNTELRLSYPGDQSGPSPTVSGTAQHPSLAGKYSVCCRVTRLCSLRTVCQWKQFQCQGQGQPGANLPQASAEPVQVLIGLPTCCRSRVCISY